MNNKEITIVYIVTGIYKQFFEKFFRIIKKFVYWVSKAFDCNIRWIDRIS